MIRTLTELAVQDVLTTLYAAIAASIAGGAVLGVAGALLSTAAHGADRV